MITVKVNGKEVQKYEGKKVLAEIVAEMYPKDSVLDSIKVDSKNVPISRIEDFDLLGNRTVELDFISIAQSILRISDSALKFLEWIDLQNLDKEVFSLLPRIVSGFEALESAIISIRQFRKDVEKKEEEDEKSTYFIEINSFIALENKDEVIKRVKNICGIYRKIFLRVLETEVA